MDIVTKALDIQASEPLISKGDRSENIQPNPRVDLSLITTPEWNFSQLVGKKRLLTSANVTPSTGGTIFSYENNVVSFLNTFSNINISNYFAFIRYNLHFEIEVQSHFQHQGSLIVNTIPFAINSSVYNFLGLNQDIINANNINRILLPHDFITFGHNGNYQVVLPWTCNRSMLPVRIQSSSTASNDLRRYHLNSLVISVFDPLQAVASAVSTTTVRIWVHAEDVQYSGFMGTY